MTTLTLVAIRCANPYCREVTRTGRRQVIGEIDADAKAADLWCAKCKQVTRWRR